MTTKFSITGICQLELSHTKGDPKSKHVATNIRLEISDNLDKKQYMDAEGRPDKAGSQALTQAFIAGLSANIHSMHQKGWRDSAEHLRYIIAELERQFSSVAEVKDGTM